MIRIVWAVGVIGLAVGSAAAGGPVQCDKPDCPGKKLNPFSDGLYIRKFCGPTVNAGACFGYYRPQWRSWHEACGEPEPFNPGPSVGPSAAGTPTNPMPPPDANGEAAPGRAPIAPKAPLTPPDKPKEKKPELSSSAAPRFLPAIPVSRQK